MEHKGLEDDMFRYKVKFKIMRKDVMAVPKPVFQSERWVDLKHLKLNLM